MTEEVPERSELIASISSQVAEGVGPLITEIVEKRFREGKQEMSRQSTPKPPTLSHPGLQAQATLLLRWVKDVEEIEESQDEEQRKEKCMNLKKNLKRRLTTVVGADTDPTIFNLADTFDKVESTIDQSDEFGRAVAEHLKKAAAAKSRETRNKGKFDQPFRKGGYPGGAGVSAPQPSFALNPTTSLGLMAPPLPVAPWSQLASNPAYMQYPGGGEATSTFYPFSSTRLLNKPQTLPRRPCFNCGQHGHYAASCTFAKKPQQ
ncbi:hypothetical protein Y032_0040g271 [Ancylostoma ceylanicum]|uniref:CCHC-type domain-containing protein n=1 Tax=Ancylostoma ceylanicum TaxID=53326 RepID=A0A016UHE4_9BILA|nr:hypothetical protein Y032_0040g271 [Ancylostoma ceylanicum]